jgi:hypothetical protein
MPLLSLKELAILHPVQNMQWGSGHRRLVHLLLLVKADLTGTHVDEEEKAADDGEDLEEVVLGEVLVGVVLVELWIKKLLA